MSKVQPIPQELWGALGLMVNHFEFAQTAMGNWNPRVTKALELLKEYHACFDANGNISQRGEIPHCWNRDTIFKSHRMRREHECLLEQPLLPFTKEDNDD